MRPHVLSLIETPIVWDIDEISFEKLCLFPKAKFKTAIPFASTEDRFTERHFFLM